MTRLLEIKDLIVDFHSNGRLIRAVGGLNLNLYRGETLGIVGESGSGKSVTALSIMQLLPVPQAVSSRGNIFYFSDNETEPVDLLQLKSGDIQKIRGARIAMVFQEPMTSLNPVFRCGDQVVEAILLHRKIDSRLARQQALELFERVKLPDAERIFEAYPHELSGGQKQRVLIAMSLCCHPEILIADEPTTALDVTVQRSILDLIRELQAEMGLTVLFISHDLGVIAEICNRVVVMHQGAIVEAGSTDTILRSPADPYTRGLIACRPSIAQKWKRLPTVQDFFKDSAFKAEPVSVQETETRIKRLTEQKPILEVRDLLVRYPLKRSWSGEPRQWLHAVDGLSFDVYPGETFGLAGESGSGKSTLGKAIARLIDARSGTVCYRGQELLQMDQETFRPFRRQIQVVFQDPYASLNPRIPIGAAIMEPMEVHRLFVSQNERREKAVELLETVGLEADHFNRLPHEFSGGQRQRICLARALSLQPSFIVCDEIVSALDVSVQATILNLLKELQDSFGLTYLFISHDLSVIQQMCDRVLVMKNGKQDALGFAGKMFEKPPTPYVQQLVESIPKGLTS